MGEGKSCTVGVLTFSVNNAGVGCTIYGRHFRLNRLRSVPARTTGNNRRVVGAVVRVVTSCSSVSQITVDATNRISSRGNVIICSDSGVPCCANVLMGGVIRAGAKVPAVIRGSIGTTTLKRTVFNTTGNCDSFIYLAFNAKVNNTVCMGGDLCGNYGSSTKRFKRVVARTNNEPYPYNNRNYCRRCTSTGTLARTIRGIANRRVGNFRVFDGGDLLSPRVHRIISA